MCAYFLALYSVPLIYVSVFVPASYYFEYYRFIVQSEVMDYDISSSVPLSQDHFGWLGSFFYTFKNFKIVCSSYMKFFIVIFIGIALKMQNILVRIISLKILNFQFKRKLYFLSVFFVFSSFHQCLIVFQIQVFFLPPGLMDS